MKDAADPDDGDRADDSEPLFRRGLAAILIVAAAVRLTYLAQTLGDPLLRDVLILDSRIYDDMANRIAGGDWAAGDEAFAFGPLYTYFLALLRRTFGGGTAVVYSIQQILGLGSILLTALLARRCFGVRAALLAAALTGLYGAMALLELKIMASTLAVFLGLASLQLLLVARDRGWRCGALLPGLVLGWACLARPNLLLFAPAAALWMLWDGRTWREAGRRFDLARLPATLALIAGVVLAIAPATLRNHAVADDWVLISAQGGMTFYQANNELATGLYARLPGLSGSPSKIREKFRARAEQASGRALTVSEVNRYWARKGVDFLVGNPGAAAKLTAKKLLYWTNNAEYSTEYVLPTERELTPTLWLMPVPFALIFAPAALILAPACLGRRGIRSGRQAERLLLLSFALTNLATILIFFFASRYRLPAVPVLAVFAGAGIVELIDRLRGDLRRFFVSICIALVLGACSMHSWSDTLRPQGAQQLFNYGQIYYQRGLFEAAAEKYRAALVTFEKRWQLHLSLANAYTQLGDYGAALLEYERVLEVQPDHPVAGPAAALARAKLGETAR